MPEIAPRLSKYSRNRTSVTESSLAAANSYGGEDSTFRLRGHRTYIVNSDIRIKDIKIIDDPKKKSRSPKEKSKGLDSALNALRRSLELPVNKFLMITCPAFEKERVKEKELLEQVAEEKRKRDLEKIEEEDEMMPDLEFVEQEKEKMEVVEEEVGSIRSKMRGNIAGLEVVKRKKARVDEKKDMTKLSEKSSSASGGDWRLEIKKREKAKMQEKMNAMKIGMPDYREPEKVKQLNWRDNLKQVVTNIFYQKR